MDAYPPAFVARNTPLFVLSGLDIEESPQHPLQASGPRIGSENVQIHRTLAAELAEAFKHVQALESWNGEGEGAQPVRAHFQFCRSQYHLPARKASPQASVVEDPLDAPSPTSPTPRVLHSPLSPLSTSSPLHPDGLMTPLWVAKYQQMIPAVFISFFSITSDRNTDSLHDNQLKNEIASIRNSLEDTKYRSRYAVVLVGDGSVVNGPDLEERVTFVRRAARLDASCVFFVDGKNQNDQLNEFASRVTAAMHPQAMEFYRDLTRHTRRKRDKGSNPSHSITRLGWLSRYEYKLGILAEFRKETDVAARHYNTAMMAFFDSQGPFETISSWSPRWNEARVWSDTTFIRLIRAQLANDQPTAAVRSWTRHKDRIGDLLERKAKGTDNYGYITWEARWSAIMAELTRSCTELFDEPLSDESKQNQKRALRVFARIEQSLMQEQQAPPLTTPWQYLHHAGYWLRKSISLTKKRLAYAIEIPGDDRIPPGRSPASAVARRHEAYDTYLSLEPHSEWEASQDKGGIQAHELATSLGRAAGDFQAHEQHRFADQYRLELCQQLMQASQHAEAMKILMPLWQQTRWRAEQWRNLLQDLSTALYHCAIESEDAATRVATLWELSSSVFAPVDSIDYDILRCLATVSNARIEPRVFDLHSASCLSCLKATFSFGSGMAYAGVALPAQLVIHFDAHETCSPLLLQKILIEFDACITQTEILHAEASTENAVETKRPNLQTIAFEDDDDIDSRFMSRRSDLRFKAGQAKAFDVLLMPEEAGSCQAKTAIVYIGDGTAMIKYSSSLSAVRECQTWLSPASNTEQHPKARPIPARTSLKIQPRPPKMDLDFVGLRNIYYTDEAIQLELDIINEENEDAQVELAIEALSDSDVVPGMSWKDDGDPPLDEASGTRLRTDLGHIPVGASTSKVLVMQPSKHSSDMVVEARVTYTLPSSAGRKISKAINADVVVIRPFEAVHQVFPDFHDELWPNYFQVEEEDPPDVSSDVSNTGKHTISGTKSRWQSRVRLTSFATDTLIVEDVSLEICPLKGSSRITAARHETQSGGVQLISNGQHTVPFTLEVQKSSMDEPRPVISTPILHLTWRRFDSSSDEMIRSQLELTRLSIAGSEPRVLARQLPTENDRMIAIEYVIENPSLHFLTFNISIESSEDFAFSGPKSSTLQLTPLSRHGIKYLFMPFVKGKHIRPDIQIMDVYFNKVLGVIPTGDLRSEQGELKAYVNEAP